jgi:hypothetical protein
MILKVVFPTDTIVCRVWRSARHLYLNACFDLEDTMPDTRFVYTVSGVELSEAQKAAISQEIGAVVSRALLGDIEGAKALGALQSNVLNISKIHGGKWIVADLVANETVGEVTARAEG